MVMDRNKRFDGSSSNRRKWPRMTWRRKHWLLWAGNTFCQDAEMLDESTEGVALLVKDGSVVQIGQEIRLTDGDRSVSAIVKHVHQREDGKYHLGLAWGGLVTSSSHDYCLA
jgi:hypothetical protein